MDSVGRKVRLDRLDRLGKVAHLASLVRRDPLDQRETLDLSTH